MKAKEIKNTIFMVVMFIPTMVVAFFVLLTAKFSGRQDWSRD